VLHPARRIEYLKQMRWEQEWINELVQIAHNTFEFDYTSVKEVFPEPSLNHSALDNQVRTAFDRQICRIELTVCIVG